MLSGSVKCPRSRFVFVCVGRPLPTAFVITCAEHHHAPHPRVTEKRPLWKLPRNFIGTDTRDVMGSLKRLRKNNCLCCEGCRLYACFALSGTNAVLSRLLNHSTWDHASVVVAAHFSLAGAPSRSDLCKQLIFISPPSLVDIFGRSRLILRGIITSAKSAHRVLLMDCLRLTY